MRFEPISVSILTGFLGAGKTTLLNRLLKSPALTNAAVIVNEFGEVGLDHLLVEESSEGIIELSDGCLCCTVRGDLVDTLAELIERRQTGRIEKLERIVIETSGLADPVPVMQAVMGHPVLQYALRLDGVVTLADAVNGLSTLDRHEEARRQVAVADRLVLTKTDIADAGAVDALTARIRALNPRARLLVSGHEGEPADLMRCGLYDPETKTADVRAWLGDGHAPSDHGHAHDHDHPHHHHHDDGIRTVALEHDGPVAPAALEMFLDLLRAQLGPSMLRMKGIVELADDPERPLVIHGVQAMLHPPARLPRWPDGFRGTRIVIIGHGMEEDYLRRLFGAFMGEPALDTPDRQALSDNPLAIAGFRP